MNERQLRIFYEVAKSVPDILKEVRINYLDSFKHIVTVMIEGRQAELNAEKDKQRANDEIHAEIEVVKGKKSFFPQEVRLVAEVLENLP